ncbi:MAG: TlpA disulfide reductase family protein [Flavobacteriales bacterium]|jgi:peroxiredoxin|nr:TlpA disulfide reductase family protein [Flavobacteriales bacterium]
MEHQPLLWACCLLMAACTSGGDSGTLTVEIADGGGRTLYLESISGRSPVRIDSTTLSAGGAGRLSLHALPMDYYRITFGEGSDLVLAVDSTSHVTVQAPAHPLHAATSVQGPAHTEGFFRFQQATIAFEEQRERIRQAMQERPGDPALLAELNALNAEYHDLCKRTATADPGAPVALSAVSRLPIEDDTALYKQVRDALHATMPRSGFYTKFKSQVDRIEQQEIARRLQEEELRRLSMVAPPGSPAPEIKQATPDGGQFALSQLRGKVVLIDFWASWCRPCRIENPRLKEVYAQYKGRGFEILGVSLDRDKGAWTTAIADDGLPWKHVSDLRYWQNAAALEYAVSSIPHGVLVDREGKIVAKGVRAHELAAKLDELL